MLLVEALDQRIRQYRSRQEKPARVDFNFLASASRLFRVSICRARTAPYLMAGFEFELIFVLFISHVDSGGSTILVITNAYKNAKKRYLHLSSDTS